MSSYRDTLTYLFALQYRGMKFGLRNIRSLLASAGHPERRFPSIHVAGTNGKGSTASFLASILREAGARTGLYTSPHLVRFTERIRIDGREIPEQRLADYVRVLRPAIERYRATFFEATTCVAFLYFADEGVDCAVVEAGLGGRLDATNVLRPLLSVITNVSLEHMEYLGPTVRAIAREKGGIIKAGVPVVTGSADPEVVGVLKAIAIRKRAPFFESRNLVRVRAGRKAGTLTMSGDGIRLSGIRLGLRGRHQEMNAALALAAIRMLSRIPGVSIISPGLTAGALRAGFFRVRKNTGLEGRLQTIRAGGGFILDVAHNPEGMRVLAGEIAKRRVRPSVAVFGVMKDKDYRPMLAALARVVDRIIAVAPRMDRALPARTLWKEGRASGIAMVMGGTVTRGIHVARQFAGNRPVLVTGSHYVAGEALTVLGRENT